MFLTQGESAFLFTLIRLALQLSSVFLISHLASRSYNLTYLERIHGGSLSRINYLLFTKFPSGRKQYLGRFYVALALVITTAFQYLPTLLSGQYPVRPIFLESNQNSVNVSSRFMKTTVLTTNSTSVETILFNMNFQLNGAVFDQYTASPPQPMNCTPLTIIGPAGSMACDGGRTITLGTPYDQHPRPLIMGPQAVPCAPDTASPTTIATHAGSFSYYNLSQCSANIGNYMALSYIFDHAGHASSSVGDDMMVNGARSVEACLRRKLSNRRCARHSIGYLMGPNNSTFLVTRKLLGQTTLSKYANPDCATLATPALETVCNEILSLSYLGQRDRVYSIQLMTSNPQKAAVQWTIVSTYWAIDPDNGAPPPIPFPGYSLVMETMSLDIAVLAYPTALDAAQQIFIQNNDTRFATSGQEVFETTNFVPAWVDTADKSWANFGFTDDDLRNLTRFILAGTLLNSGVIIVRNPSLLADVPTMVVGLSFGISLFMGTLALIVSWNVAPMVRRPITEVLAEIAASKKNHTDGDEDYVKNGKKKIRSFSSFHRHRVANLTLALLKDTEQSNAEIISLNGAHSRINDTLGRRTMNPEHRSKKEKKMFLRMDLDNEYKNDDNNNDSSSNSDDTMKLLDISI